MLPWCAVRLFLRWFGAARRVEYCFRFSRSVALVCKSAFFSVALGLLVMWNVALVSHKMLLWCVMRLFCSPLGAAASVVSYSVRPYRPQPTRLPRPWDSPGTNTGVGCHFCLRLEPLVMQNVALVCNASFFPLPGAC